jgi:hypothetical protein
MKKILLGTTALAAAGLLATQAQAAEPIKISVGGYYQSYIVFADYDEKGIPDQQNFYVKQEGEIKFAGSTTLDNGLKVGVNVELEGYTTGDQIDEHYVWFSGTFGRLEIGAHDAAPYLMFYGGQSAIPGHGLSSPNFFHYTTAGVGTPAKNAAISTLPTTRLNTVGDTNKIIYFTPRFNGFQLGVSYAPDFDTGGGEGGQYGTDIDGDGEFEDSIAVGMNFVQKFNDVGVNFYAGAMWTQFDAKQGCPAFLDSGCKEWHPEYGVGGNVTFSGFTIGGSYNYDAATLPLFNDVVRHAVEGGVMYAPSAQWAFSVLGYYAWIEDDDNHFSNNDGDSFFTLEVGGRYVLGPGILLGGGVQYYDADADTPGFNPGEKNDGFAVFFGSTLVF